MTTARGAGRILLCFAAVAPAVWLWTTSPQLMVHRSASGDVFVRAPDKSMQRVRFAHGDGLVPLGYSTLEARDAASCRAGWRPQLAQLCRRREAIAGQRLMLC